MIAIDVVFPTSTGVAVQAAAPKSGVSMGVAIPRQPAAVVLRSQFNQLRALLAVALIAVAGLTVAVVILANDNDQAAGTSSARPIESINYGESKYLSPSTGGESKYLSPSTGGESKYLSPSTGGESRYLNPSTGPRAIYRHGSPALVNQSSEATGDYAHGPLAPPAPTKDYSKNGATGDYSTEPQAKSGSRADGASDEAMNLRAP
jgi:hypothetical protein